MYGSFPFDRYGQDAVYPYAWGGMEHQELSTIHRNWILNVDEDGMAHELSHQWWGDMVTCVDFRDIWLNEGFATYSDANYSWWRFGHSQFLSIMEGRAQDYFTADASNRRPLYNPPLNQIFNWGYTYCKACWVVHMLRYINEADYFPAVHAYRDSFEYSTANTEDIKRVFSGVYGSDLAWFFDEWVYGQGYPDYRVYWVCNPSGGDYLFRTNIYQVQTNAPPVFHMPLQIMLHKNGGDTLVNIQVSTSPQYAQFLVSDSITNITFDPNHYVLQKNQIYVGLEELIGDQPVPDRLFVTGNPGREPLLSYFLNRTQNIELILYDAAGRKSAILFTGRKTGGLHYQSASAASAGIYFCCLETENTSNIKKLVIVK
jgi:aminopeptidase N